MDTSADVQLRGKLDPSTPVVLSIDGQGSGHGSATIDGNATRELTTAAAVTLKLRGTTQTEPKQGGQLRLVASQQGKQIASSQGFSVSAIPQDMSFSFLKLAEGDVRGIWVKYDWDSDSKNPSDLDEAGAAERVEYPSKTPEALGHCYSSLGGGIDMLDRHALKTSSLTTPMTITAKQTFMFKDDRTGAADIPMTHSGFIIKHIVQAKKPGPGLEVITSKNGAAEKSQDPDTVCKAGPIQSEAGSGSTKSPPQDL